jgi:hypothetical protein
MVSEAEGLEFESQSRIYMLHVIIPSYKSPYGGARVAQTSGGRALAGTQ